MGYLTRLYDGECAELGLRLLVWDEDFAGSNPASPIEACTAQMPVAQPKNNLVRGQVVLSRMNCQFLRFSWQ